MAYNDYLLKIKGTSGSFASDYEFPKTWIEAETFKVVRGVQDKDSYRDGNGVLHRTALAHTIYKGEFQVRENIKASEYNAIMEQIQGRYINVTERKLRIDAYVTETGQYTGSIDVYMPDPEVTIKKIIKNDLVYKTIRFAFIQY